MKILMFRRLLPVFTYIPGTLQSGKSIMTDSSAAAAAANAAAVPAPAAAAANAAASNGGPQVVVMYGSQNGTAESIARGLSTEAHSRGFNSSCHPLDSYESVSPRPPPAPPPAKKTVWGGACSGLWPREIAL